MKQKDELAFPVLVSSNWAIKLTLWFAHTKNIFSKWGLTYSFFTDIFLALFQSAVIGDEKAEMFRTKITGRVQMLNMLQMVLMIAGAVLFVSFMGSYFICRSKKLK